MNEVMRQEMRFRLSSLEPGWYDGEGASISALALAQADAILAILPKEVALGFSVFPRDKGGVSLEWLSNSAHISISVNSDASCWLYYFHLTDDNSAELSTTDAKAAVEFALQYHPVGRSLA